MTVWRTIILDKTIQEAMEWKVSVVVVWKVSVVVAWNVQSPHHKTDKVGR